MHIVLHFPLKSITIIAPRVMKEEEEAKDI